MEDIIEEIELYKKAIAMCLDHEGEPKSINHRILQDSLKDTLIKNQERVIHATKEIKAKEDSKGT